MTAVPRPRSWLRVAWDAGRVVGGNRAIVRLQLAYLAAFTASAMLLIDLAVIAFDQGGAPGVAVMTLVQMLPAVAVVPLIAGMGERASRRTMLLVSVGACAAAAAFLAGSATLGGPMLLVYLLAAVLATAAGVAWAVVGALLPALARTPDELVGANVASTATEGVGALIGPLLAAILLGVGGPASIAIVAAVGYLVSFVLAWGVRPPPSLPGAVAIDRMRARSLMTEAAEGLLTLLRRPGPRLITLAMFVQMVVRGALSVLLVVLAFEVLDLGEAGVGLLTAAIGLGGLAGSVVAMGVASGRPLGPLLGIALVGWGLPIALLAPMPSAAMALVLLVVVGVSGSLIDVAGFGLLQGCVPDRARTGAMGAVEGVVALGMATGGVLASLLLAVLDVPVVLLLVGLLLPLLAVLQWPRWRALDGHLLVSRDQVARLQRCAIFAPLSLAQLEQIAAGTTEVQFAAGAAIIREGEQGDAFYLLTEGEVAVTQAGRHLNTLGPGGSFGELALLRGVPRTATVTASGPVTADRVAASTFVSALTGSSRSRSAAEAIAQRYLPVEG